MRSRNALRELEVPNPGPPISASHGIIFLGVPKGAVVHWINRHCAVISPAAVSTGLAARSIKEMNLALGQRIHRIIKQPASITNLGENRRVGSAKAHGQIAREIQRDASHPTPDRVRLIG